jgi:hypothetical protein
MGDFNFPVNITFDIVLLPLEYTSILMFAFFLSFVIDRINIHRERERKKK